VSSIWHNEKLPKRCRTTKIMLDIVKDGVSIVVIDKSNNKVVGASLNKIHVTTNQIQFSLDQLILFQVRPAPGEKTYHGKFEDVSNESSNRLCAKFDDYTVSTFFELCQVDCLLELTMVGLLPEYRKDGNGRLIYQTVIDLGRGLVTGVNTKQPVDGQELGLEPVPEIITGVCTTEKAWVKAEAFRFLNWSPKWVLISSVSKERLLQTLWTTKTFKSSWCTKA
jgi:hypothetical protein